MTFIQIVDVDIDEERIDEVVALDDEWKSRTEGERTTARATFCRDRANPSRVVAIVEFPSYEEAMRNSELPATQEFAEKLGKLARSVRFVDLDVMRVDED